MTARLIVQEQGGTLGFRFDSGEIDDRCFGSQPFAPPLTPEELEDLRWYLEDYLRAPYAVWEDRGQAIADRLDAYGHRLFDCLFGAGKPGRDAFVHAEGQGEYELWLSSHDPGFLGLPWELMRDPDPGRPEPLAFRLAGINRTVGAAQKAAEVPGGEILRVLMLIARPYGEQDAAYRAVARPLFQKLEAVAGRVEIDLVRPPTLDAVRQCLKAAKDRGEPYHILHFDGHGTFGAAAPAPGGEFDPERFKHSGAKGYLAFERETGGAELVAAEDVAAALAEGGVPVLVLNACRSGQVAGGADPEAAVATRLAQAGAAAVVAMGYSVYVRAAAEFMAAFYEALFEGETVMRAVARGRLRLRRRALRPSPKGDLPLQDWCVPVHYGRRAVSFPQLRRTPERRQRLSLDAALDRIETVAADPTKAAEDALAPEGGAFFGRDRAFHRLEQALEREPVTLIHGLGGTGKTEFAKAYARWLLHTGWPDAESGVVFHELKPGLATFDLAGILAAIGRALYGERFALVDPAKQAAVVLDTLSQHRVVVVLDNFESVRSMPDPTGATPPLSDADAAGLAGFLQTLRARRAKCCLLITSRSPEPWLGEVNRLPLGGLEPEEVNEYVDHLIGRLPQAPARRQKKAFGELLERLGGHPLSLRLMLPQLDRREPDALLQALKGEAALDAPDADGMDKAASLEACVRYSLDQLGADAADKLVALTLFEDVAEVAVLSFFEEVPDCPERFGTETLESWRQQLWAATSVGLLTELGGGMFRIHPALPAILVRRWQECAGAAYARERKAAERAFIHAYAAFGSWLWEQINHGAAELAFHLIDRQRRSLGRALGEALACKLFAPAQHIMQPLNEYWVSRGLAVEAKGWVDRVRVATEDEQGRPPSLDAEAGALWLFAVGSEANRTLQAGHFDAAESAYTEIAGILEATPDEKARRPLAGLYHQLGWLAQARGALGDAERWYRESLAIRKKLGDRPGMATSYHQLGIIAQRRGMAAQHRGTLQEAELWYREAEQKYRKSLAIEKRLDNQSGIASSYHQLGWLAQCRGALDDAEQWYQKSLAIRQGIGDRPGMAASYGHLGMVARDRGALDEAEQWYQKSLAIEEALGNRPGMASSYGQLGLLAEVRDDLPMALAWTVHCVALFEAFPHPATGPAPWRLARLTGRLGMPVLEAAWRKVTGKALPADVRAWVEAHRDDPGDQKGA